MERMTEKKIGKRKVKVHRMEGLYPYVRLEDFMQVCKGLEEENKKLKEKVETLELRLDNKEKLNEEYRDKIDLLKYQSYGPSELADSLYDANKTIEKLKEELDKLRTDNIYEEGLYD